MASLVDLLRYKEEMDIIDPRTGEFIAKVWVRILGDLDLTKAYRVARLASAAKREALRNPETEDYQDEILGVADLTIDEQKDLIKTSKLSTIVAEATIAVDRPELPKLEEIAIEPDAASLEELEKLDKAENKVEDEYQKKIDEYIAARTEEVVIQLDQLSQEELLKMAQYEASNVVPFTIFLNTLNAQKAILGTFEDKACTTHAFKDEEEFLQLPKYTQESIIRKIQHLEVSGPTIKN